MILFEMPTSQCLSSTAGSAGALYQMIQNLHSKALKGYAKKRAEDKLTPDFMLWTHTVFHRPAFS